MTQAGIELSTSQLRVLITALRHQPTMPRGVRYPNMVMMTRAFQCPYIFKLVSVNQYIYAAVYTNTTNTSIC